jgi:hypothetical protein
MTCPEKPPTSTIIRKYIKRLEKLTIILVRRGDDESLTRVDSMKGKLKDMLDAMGVSVKGEGKATSK